MNFFSDFFEKAKICFDIKFSEYDLSKYDHLADLDSVHYLRKHLNDDKFIAVIGRGHSGTRMIPKLLYNNGIFMGNDVTRRYDTKPAEELYHAVENYNIQEYEEALNFLVKYFEQFEGIEGFRGFKLPEANLIYPFLVWLLPKARFINIVRRVYETISSEHPTDSLERWNIGETTSEESWAYQQEIVLKTPTPKYFHRVFFEDFVMNHKEEVSKISKFIGCELSGIKVYPSKAYYVDEYPLETKTERIMKELGYEI